MTTDPRFPPEEWLLPSTVHVGNRTWRSARRISRAPPPFLLPFPLFKEALNSKYFSPSHLESNSFMCILRNKQCYRITSLEVNKEFTWGHSHEGFEDPVPIEHSLFLLIHSKVIITWFPSLLAPPAQKDCLLREKLQTKCSHVVRPYKNDFQSIDLMHSPTDCGALSYRLMV